jgi:hypothetical protein
MSPMRRFSTPLGVSQCTAVTSVGRNARTAIVDATQFGVANDLIPLKRGDLHLAAN